MVRFSVEWRGSVWNIVGMVRLRAEYRVNGEVGSTILSQSSETFSNSLLKKSRVNSSQLLFL
jgi:hypothetical protein